MKIKAVAKYHWLLAVSLLCFLNSSCPMTQASDNQNIQGDLEVKAMTFNIRYYRGKDGPDSWSFRRQMAVDVIEKSQVDVIGFQELEKPQAEYLKEKLEDFEVLARYRDGKSLDTSNMKSGPANAIIYRKSRFYVDKWNTFWLSETPDVPNSKSWGNKGSRFCTWARLVDKKSGKAFYFFNTHLDHRSQYSRERSAILITEMINQREHKDPVVLTGDMNARENNRVAKFFKGGSLVVDDINHTNPVPLADTFRVKHGPEADAGTFNGFGKFKQNEFLKIDYIFTLKKTKVIDAEVIKYNENGRYPSDHCPVVAHLIFQ